MGRFPGLGVPQHQTGEAAPCALQPLHHGGGKQGEVPPLRRLRHQDGVRPEGIPPVDQRHMAADVRQIQGVLKGGVAAAGHGRVLSGVKGPVAHRAVGDPRQTILTGKAQRPAAHPDGQDHGARGVGSIVRDHPLRRAVPDLQHLLQLDPGPQGLRLAVQAVRQLCTGDSGQARKILHLGGRGDLPAEALLFQQQHGLSGPAGIDGGGEPGRTAAHDDNVEIGFHGDDLTCIG